MAHEFCFSQRATKAALLTVAFGNFASKWPLENLEEALAEGTVTGHPDIPVFMFEVAEVEALIDRLRAIAKGLAAPPVAHR